MSYEFATHTILVMVLVFGLRSGHRLGRLGIFGLYCLYPAPLRQNET